MPSRFTRTHHSIDVHFDAIPARPPREVLEAIAAAHEAYERLEESGRQVRFDLNEATGRLAMELTDLSGTLLRSLSPHAVLDLAAGAARP
jgi:hypothetical protein